MGYGINRFVCRPRRPAWHAWGRLYSTAVLHYTRICNFRRKWPRRKKDHTRRSMPSLAGPLASSARATSPRTRSGWLRWFRWVCQSKFGQILQSSLLSSSQSPFFDGKQPNWYHYSCFFKTCSLHAISEISGFGSLRWDDQEKIKKKISGGGGGSESTDGPAPFSSSKKKKITRSDLQVEYAKSKRSSCKGCNSQIDKVSVC